MRCERRDSLASRHGEVLYECRTPAGYGVGGRSACEKSGAVLLSGDPAVRVPSALVVLTAVFGMGTGVAPPLSAPECGVCGSAWGCARPAYRRTFTRIVPHAAVLGGVPGSRRVRSGEAQSRETRLLLDDANEEEVSGRLVPVSSTPCGASTSGLSTWWSPTALHSCEVEISSWSWFRA